MNFESNSSTFEHYLNYTGVYAVYSPKYSLPQYKQYIYEEIYFLIPGLQQSGYSAHMLDYSI